MNVEALLFDGLAHFPDGLAHMLGGQAILHLVKADEARGGEQLVAVAAFVDRRHTLGGQPAHGAGERGAQAAAFGQQPKQPVFHDHFFR